MITIPQWLSLHNRFARISAKLEGEEKSHFRKNWDLKQFKGESLTQEECNNINLAFDRLERSL